MRDIYITLLFKFASLHGRVDIFPIKNIEIVMACGVAGINFSKVAEQQRQEIFQAALVHLTTDFQRLKGFIFANTTTNIRNGHGGGCVTLLA
jgi:hypothetical protein